MNTIFQENKLAFCLKALILFVIFNFHAYTSDSEFEEEKFDSRKVTLKVYLLHPNMSIEESLKEKDSSSEEAYSHYDCQVNAGCHWYSKQKSRTTPKFWGLVVAQKSLFKHFGNFHKLPCCSQR